MTFRQEKPLFVLALDTTTRAGSAALVEGDRVCTERTGDPSLTHGRRLPGDLMRLLADGGRSLGDVDLFAVAAGPGSFTGLRVGISTVQGLAMATGRRVVPVSAFEALAQAGADASRPVAVWMDAQRGEVFAALFDPSGRQLLIAPSALPPDATLDAWKDRMPPGPARFIGDGAARYAASLHARGVAASDIVQETPPIAGILGRIAASEPGRAVLPHAVVPLYVRRPDAELARLRKAGVER